jgi:hypothetical protein
VAVQVSGVFPEAGVQFGEDGVRLTIVGGPPFTAIDIDCVEALT